MVSSALCHCLVSSHHQSISFNGMLVKYTSSLSFATYPRAFCTHSLRRSVSSSDSSSIQPPLLWSWKSICAGLPPQSWGHLTSQLEYSHRRSPNILMITAMLVVACKSGDVCCRSFPIATADKTHPRNCFGVKSRTWLGTFRKFHGSSPMRQALYAHSPNCWMALAGEQGGPLSANTCLVGARVCVCVCVCFCARASVRACVCVRVRV